PGHPGRLCRTRFRSRAPCALPLQVLAAGDLLDETTLLVASNERAHIDDPLTLLPRDLGPVVGVGGVGQVFVLTKLLLDRRDEVGLAYAPGATGDLALDGVLLGPSDDVLDHGPAGEVLEV